MAMTNIDNSLSVTARVIAQPGRTSTATSIALVWCSLSTVLDPDTSGRLRNFCTDVQSSYKLEHPDLSAPDDR